MESQIFTWVEYDDHGDDLFTYYEVELVVSVGKYPKGTKFAMANVCFGDDPVMEFYEAEGGAVAVKIALTLQFKVV